MQHARAVAARVCVNLKRAHGDGDAFAVNHPHRLVHADALAVMRAFHDPVVATRPLRWWGRLVARASWLSGRRSERRPPGAEGRRQFSSRRLRGIREPPDDSARRGGRRHSCVTEPRSDYAGFLGVELWLAFQAGVLAVMSNGLGVYPSRRHGCRCAGRPRAQPRAPGAGPPPSRASSDDVTAWVVFALGAVVILLAWAASLRARLLGKTSA